jgi:hypothetical protein
MEDLDAVLDFLVSAMINGAASAKAVVSGEAPDLDALERWAEGMNVLRKRIANRTVYFGWVQPTEDDVSAAQRLVQLVREGAPHEALVEPALRVLRVTEDPETLHRLCMVLPWLAGERSNVNTPELVQRVPEMLDRALSLFERGVTVGGFTPTRVDLARLQRLRELAAADSAEALAERRRLVAEFWARLPNDGWTAGARYVEEENPYLVWLPRDAAGGRATQ